jgi:hypothetical protein
MIPLRRILSLICQFISTACLVSGFASVGQWAAWVLGLMIFLAWLSDLKWPSGWLPPLLLIASTGLAAVGLFTGVSPLAMILAATFALSSWDLVLFDHTLVGISSSQTVSILEKKHFQSLALALGLGLLVTITGRVIRFQIPFAGMVILVILVLFSLERLWRALNAKE